eukprot:gene35556-40216_t
MTTIRKRALLAALAAAPLMQAHAGATIPIGEDKSVSVGFGMRGSYSSVEDGASNGTSRSNDLNLDSARLFFGASLNKNIKGMFNTEWDGDKIRVLDAAGQFAISPELNIWAGRLLSPSDRANMAGPYYSLGGGYWAGVSSRYGYTGGKAFDASLPTVVFIHGAQNDHSVWALQSRYLAHHGYGVLAVDLPGRALAAAVAGQVNRQQGRGQTQRGGNGRLAAGGAGRSRGDAGGPGGRCGGQQFVELAEFVVEGIGGVGR